MRARHLILAGTSLFLIACGRADAATADPTDDVHCSVLAFVFAKESVRLGSPPDQQRALATIHDWYAAKIRAHAAKVGGDKVRQQAAPVLAAVNADPEGMKDEMRACTDRAINDPAFKAANR